MKAIWKLMMLALLSKVIMVNAQQKVVGYMINWGDGPSLIETLDYSKYTHLNYCFQNPINNSGDLNTWNPRLTSMVSKAHAQNVKVLISLGGAGTSSDATLKSRWQTLMAPANRAGFIQKISNYMTTYNLDGVDVDVEGDGINGDLDGFIVELCNTLQPKGKLVTAAIKSDFGNPMLFNNSLSKMDFMNVMAYDKVGSWDPTPGQHSSYQYAVDMMNYWLGRGVAANKLILGVPFYGYGWNSNPGAWSYKAILAQFPGSENNDQVGNIIYYNGRKTIKDKCTYACKNNFGGIMIWELTNDVTGSNSLISAVYEGLAVCGGKPTITITSPINNASFNSPASVTITANASTPSGSITKVEFYNGSTLLNTDISSPYSYTWNNVAGGNYTITAIATNSTSSTTTSLPIKINVAGPYGGSAWNIPGTIQAENYNYGGEGVAYHETTTGNSGTAYRTEDVDVETMGTSGYDVGYTDIGEWMNYNVNVLNSGSYNIKLNLAATATGKKLHIEMDGNNITNSINVPNTGAWSTYQEVTVPNIALTQGNHVMKIYMETDGFNVDYLKYELLPASTITFNNIIKKDNDPAFNLSATSNSSGSLTYSIISGSQYATVTSAGLVTIISAGTVQIKVSQAAANGYSASSATATLTINKNTVGITDDQINNLINVYSNQNDEIIIEYLDNNTSTASVIIYNSNGQIVYIKENLTVNNGLITIDNVNINNGLYILKTITNNKFYVGKFIDK